MNDEDGDGVMKYSGRRGDLWNSESSELGFSNLTNLVVTVVRMISDLKLITVFLD